MKTLLLAIAVLFAAPAVAGETSFSTSVYFDTSKSTVTAEAAKTLELVASQAKGEYVVQVNAVGSADVRKFNTNLTLAQARADAVKKALVVLGVKAELINASATGDRLAAQTKDPKALAKDRRVDITVYKRFPEPVAAPAPVLCPDVVVVKTVVKTETKTVEIEKPSKWEIMAFGEFGAHKNTHAYPAGAITQTNLNGKFNNWGVWQFGTEFHYLPARLGLRTQAGNNGFGAIAQIFPVQGRLSWYIGPGLAYTSNPFYRPVSPSVQRYWDLQLQTGVEYAFTEHIVGLADVRADIPMPWNNTYSLTGKNVGDALKQTAFLVGLGYRF